MQTGDATLRHVPGSHVYSRSPPLRTSGWLTFSGEGSARGPGGASVRAGGVVASAACSCAISSALRARL